jgi:hypothetical protein
MLNHLWEGPNPCSIGRLVASRRTRHWKRRELELQAHTHESISSQALANLTWSAALRRFWPGRPRRALVTSSVGSPAGRSARSHRWISTYTAVERLRARQREAERERVAEKLRIPSTVDQCAAEGGPGKQVTTTGVDPGNISRWKQTTKVCVQRAVSVLSALCSVRCQCAWDGDWDAQRGEDVCKQREDLCHKTGFVQTAHRGFICVQTAHRGFICWHVIPARPLTRKPKKSIPDHTPLLIFSLMTYLLCLWHISYAYDSWFSLLWHISYAYDLA